MVLKSLGQLLRGVLSRKPADPRRYLCDFLPQDADLFPIDHLETLSFDGPEDYRFETPLSKYEYILKLLAIELNLDAVGAHVSQDHKFHIQDQTRDSVDKHIICTSIISVMEKEFGDGVLEELVSYPTIGDFVRRSKNVELKKRLGNKIFDAFRYGEFHYLPLFLPHTPENLRVVNRSQSGYQRAGLTIHLYGLIDEFIYALMSSTGKISPNLPAHLSHDPHYFKGKLQMVVEREYFPPAFKEVCGIVLEAYHLTINNNYNDAREKFDELRFIGKDSSVSSSSHLIVDATEPPIKSQR